MLLSSLDLLFRDPLRFLVVFPVLLALVGTALLLGITIHEYSHGLVAFRLGDATARLMGRLSLNPVRHLDPAGTVLLVIVGFGWGKPVPVNPSRVQGGRKGLALVSAAGPVSNLLAASLFALPFRLGLVAWAPPFYISTDLSYLAAAFAGNLLSLIVYYNIVLAAFNCIPIFPLDGSKVVWGLLPEEAARRFARLEPYGPALLITVLAVDLFTRIGLLSHVLVPVVNYVGQFIVGEPLF